jgi:hypothetical protein
MQFPIQSPEESLIGGGGGSPPTAPPVPNSPELNGQNTEAGNQSEDDSLEVDPFGDLDQWKSEGKYFGKYNSIRDVFSGMEELQKDHGRLKREKTPEIPEEYGGVTLDGEDLPEALKGLVIDDNDEAFAAFKPVFKELKLTQEQANGLIKAHALWANSGLPDLEKEKAALGSEAGAIIQEVDQYLAKRNVPGAVKLGQLAGQNAETLKELHYLIKKSSGLDIPAGAGQANTAMTYEEAREEAFSYREKYKDRIHVDLKIQEKYQQLMERAARLKK